MSKELTLTNKLPTIAELYNEVELRGKENALNVILNSPPKVEWLKEHPMATKKVNGQTVKAQYLPIERVEYLLTRIFINWRVEIKDAKLIGNSVVVTVRLHYRSPITNEWDWQDGIGATPLQTDKGAGAIDFNQLKSSAVQMAAPSAESYAIKDAAEKLGRLFGKDVNRQEYMDYEGLANRFVVDELQEAKKKIIDALDTYKGKNAEELRLQCADANAMGAFDMTFAHNMAKQIGLVL